MKERNLTCIVCPRGCTLAVAFDENDEIHSVNGNACPRGKTYAQNECTHPVRTVTSTVRCADGGVISVKTNSPVPKEMMFDVMKTINTTVAPTGTKIGDVIISDVCGTGAAVVATTNHGND